MEKIITIDGKDVKFRATAAIPRLYRIKFRRDIIQDIGSIRTAMAKQATDGESIPMEALTMFENVAYIMAKHGDKDAVPDDPDDWLDSFSTFSIYEIFSEIVSLWGLNMESTSTAKKVKSSTREMNTAIFLLRTVQLGISLSDLDLLTIGMVNDMYTEHLNDGAEYPIEATQEDFDRF